MLKRTFIALPVPVSEKLKNEIEFYKKNLQGLNIKWVEIKNLHLTLAFLGDTLPEQIIAIKEGLGKITSQHKPFAIKFTQAGAFKNLQNPQVLWIGLEANNSLRFIFSDIQKLIKSVGFVPENRPFKPHLTIGRVKSFTGENNLQSFVNAREALKEVAMAKSVVFYESILMPAGPVYKDIEMYNLG